MPLGAGCPRCASRVSDEDGRWRCVDHGDITPLWRPVSADYDSFAEHLTRAGAMPTLMPWPVMPGWAVIDFGSVAPVDGPARASFVTTSGPSELDGVVELTVVTEEPGVGLGARCAGVRHTDPGAEMGDGPPLAKVRIVGHPISLWPVLTSDADQDFDRSVFAGEAHGRWLWLVLRPASAALLLQEEWILMDVGELGPELMDLPFGGSPPAW
ncbi:MAG: DUF6758 family protein [Nocardioidaceae bacterium]